VKLQSVHTPPKGGRSGAAESPEIMAHRLAIYLRAVGIAPITPQGATQRQILAAYNQQWNALPARWRSRARRAGRAQMLASGLAHSRETAPFVTPQRPLIAPPAQELETVAVVCQRCRMRGGFPKRAWLSRQFAEDALLRALEIPKNFEGLHVYECPHTQGHWHLGHLRDDTSAKLERGKVEGKARFSLWVVVPGLLVGLSLIRFVSFRKGRPILGLIGKL
jgi:hypothetical protein